MAEQKKIDVVIPAYKPGEKFQKLIKMLQKQTYPIHEILIMNTEKAYFPEASVAGLPNVRVEHLTRAEFDHGGTRDKAAGLLSGDFFLFMTQDAVPADTYLVEKLAGAFDDEKVDAAYARQLPNPDCSVIERYTRSFNYPDAPSVKTKKDLPKYGIKTFFCSNVCAMYRAETYWRLGGFEKKTIFNEDMIFAGKIILNGGGIAYVPEARVHPFPQLRKYRAASPELRPGCFPGGASGDFCSGQLRKRGHETGETDGPLSDKKRPSLADSGTCHQERF